MANQRAILLRCLIVVTSFPCLGPAQELREPLQTGSIPTTAGVSPGPAVPAPPPGLATPVPVVEERRVVKGADGQWYFVAEDQKPDSTAAPEKGTAAQDGGTSWDSLRERFSQMLKVTTAGGGTLQL